MLDLITKKTGKILQNIIKIRRDLHQNPGLYFNEHYSNNIVIDHLKKLGLEYKDYIAGTGISCLIEGGEKGRTVALRADMDGLPIKEETGLPYASKIIQNIGNEKFYVMHACGHDGHTAILIGTAYVLTELRNQLKGNVKLIFQPAEEKGAGGNEMVKEGVLENPKADAVFALHGHSELPLGCISIKEGPITAFSQVFEIEIIGKGSHGAVPHESVDPIVIVSHIISGIQNISSRQINPNSPVVITIGSVHGGNLPNIIPDKVKLNGTIRTISAKDRKDAVFSIRKIVKNFSSAFKAKAKINLIEGYPAVINTPKETKLVIDVAQKVLGKNKIKYFDPSMGAEDFAYYLQKCPGAMFKLGLDDETHVHKFPHTSKFDFNDNAVKYGIIMMSSIAVKYLNNQI